MTFEQWLYLLQHDFISYFVKSSGELGPIITIYNDFPEAIQINLNNV